MQNMVLIEPNPLNWPNIKAIIERNSCSTPHSTFQGFIGLDEKPDTVYHNEYPKGIDYSKLIDLCSFRLLDEQHFVNITPQLKLDTLVSQCGIPHAINIDTEGSGLIVLQSGIKTLMEYHPLLWVSVHPDDLRPTTKFLPSESKIYDYLTHLGYRGTFLGKDHEEHYFYE